MQSKRKIVARRKITKRPPKFLSSDRNPHSRILIRRQNRESMDLFIRKMGGSIEIRWVNPPRLGIRSLSPLEFTDPIVQDASAPARAECGVRSAPGSSRPPLLNLASNTPLN